MGAEQKLLLLSLQLALPLCSGNGNSLLFSSAYGPHALRLQAPSRPIVRVQEAGVRSALVAQLESEGGWYWPLWPLVWTQGTASRVPLGICPYPPGDHGGSGPSPSHPNPISF